MTSKFILSTLNAMLVCLLFCSIPIKLNAAIVSCSQTNVFTGDNEDTKFRRTYPKSAQAKPAYNKITRKQKPTAAQKNNNAVVISYQEFLAHFSPDFTRSFRRVIPLNESISMDVKEENNFGFDPQSWVMPDFDNLMISVDTDSDQNISQFDGEGHQYRDNFTTTTGGGFIYTQHGIHIPSFNAFEFYEIQYDEQEGLGGLVSLGHVIEEGNDPQINQVEQELVPVPAAWGSTTTLNYGEGSDAPNVDFIDVEQHVEVVAFGTLTTFDDGDVQAIKVHSTLTRTTYYTDGTPPEEITEREIWWYSKDGHFLRGRVGANEPFEGMTSFTGMVYHKISPASLPIEWADFTAQVNEKQQVELNWCTATEQDNSHFIIQKSSDGRTFSKIGEQTSKGNSTAMQSYDFIDEKPILGTNYYRIQQVDFNGKSTYSEVITAIITDEATDQPTVVLYPNPGKNEVWFSQAADYDLYDAKGVLLTSGRADGVVDVSGLPTGTYFVRINSGEMLSWMKQ